MTLATVALSVVIFAASPEFTTIQHPSIECNVVFGERPLVFDYGVVREDNLLLAGMPKFFGRTPQKEGENREQKIEYHKNPVSKFVWRCFLPIGIIFSFIYIVVFGQRWPWTVLIITLFWNFFLMIYVLVLPSLLHYTP